MLFRVVWVISSWYQTHLSLTTAVVRTLLNYPHLNTYYFLAKSFADKLIAFLLVKLEVTNDRTRIGTLSIFRHLVNGAGNIVFCMYVYSNTVTEIYLQVEFISMWLYSRAHAMLVLQDHTWKKKKTSYCQDWKLCCLKQITRWNTWRWFAISSFVSWRNWKETCFQIIAHTCQCPQRKDTGHVRKAEIVVLCGHCISCVQGMFLVTLVPAPTMCEPAPRLWWLASPQSLTVQANFSLVSIHSFTQKQCLLLNSYRWRRLWDS